MERKDRDWHIGDIADEMAELQEATGILHRWSEYSDVVYTVTRARWGGHDMPSPLPRRYFIYGSLYMFPKYTSRWIFFYRAGKKAGADHKVTEVRNPKKLHKLEHIAKKHGLQPEEFIRICHHQLKYWLLPK
jgi:hypothetical protein